MHRNYYAHDAELEKARSKAVRSRSEDNHDTQEVMHNATKELQETAQESQDVMKEAAKRLKAESERITTIKQKAKAGTQTHKNKTRTMIDSSSDSDEEESDDDENDDGPTIRSYTSSASRGSDTLYRVINLPKMPVKMSKFSGVSKEENVQNWVDEFHTLKVATGWRSKETIALAGLHLTQVARNWFNHIGHKYSTWDSFSRALVKEYGRQYSPHLIRELVSQMPAQKEDETCSEFLGRVRTRLNEYGVYEDKEIADAFLERMRPEWKQQVLGNIGDTRVSSMDILAIASKWEIAVKAASNARKVRAAVSSGGEGPVGTNPITEVTVHNELNVPKKRSFRGECFNCGKKGHREADCRSEKKSDQEKQEYRERKKDEVCSHCKLKGHEEKGCWKAHPELAPKRNVRAVTGTGKGGIGGADVKVQQEEQVLVRKVPRSEGTSINWNENEKGTYVVHGRISNMSIPITVDIGADDTSCISQRTFMQLPANVRNTLYASDQALSNVDNSNLSYLGKIKVKLHLDPVDGTDSREIQVTMYVVPGLSVACLLGSDFTEKYTKCIDFQSRSMELITGEKIQVHVKSHVNSSDRHAVMLSKDITIEPYSAVITPHACALIAASSNANGSVWLTEANAAVLSDGVLVARTAQDLPTKTARGRTRVILQLTNTTPKPITYKAGRRIGLLQRIDVMVAAEAEDKKQSREVTLDHPQNKIDKHSLFCTLFIKLYTTISKTNLY